MFYSLYSGREIRGVITVKVDLWNTVYTITPNKYRAESPVIYL